MSVCLSVCLSVCRQGVHVSPPLPLWFWMITTEVALVKYPTGVIWLIAPVCNLLKRPAETTCISSLSLLPGDISIILSLFIFQISEAHPTVIQADTMREELYNCEKFEYTAENLPLLLLQVREKQWSICSQGIYWFKFWQGLAPWVVISSPPKSFKLLLKICHFSCCK